jgi:hypothetical protein
MNIEKINAQIQEFCLASGFTFGGKTATPENLAHTSKLIWEEFAEYEKETFQPGAAKEMADILYISLTESWQYGVKMEGSSLWERVNFIRLINSILNAISVGYGLSFDLHQLAHHAQKEIYALGFDFEKTFDALQESNMSKFLTKESDVEPSIFKNLQLLNPDGTQRYKNVGYVEQGGIFTIKCLETGKTLKGIHYKECDLSNSKT